MHDACDAISRIIGGRGSPSQLILDKVITSNGIGSVTCTIVYQAFASNRMNLIQFKIPFFQRYQLIIPSSFYSWPAIPRPAIPRYREGQWLLPDYHNPSAKRRVAWTDGITMCTICVTSRRSHTYPFFNGEENRWPCTRPVTSNHRSRHG